MHHKLQRMFLCTATKDMSLSCQKKNENPKEIPRKTTCDTMKTFFEKVRADCHPPHQNHPALTPPNTERMSVSLMERSPIFRTVLPSAPVSTPVTMPIVRMSLV